MDRRASGIGIVAAILTTGVGLAALMVSLIAGVNTRIDDARGELREFRTEVNGRMEGFDTRLRNVEIAFGKVDQRLLIIERFVLPTPERSSSSLFRPRDVPGRRPAIAHVGRPAPPEAGGVSLAHHHPQLAVQDVERCLDAGAPERGQIEDPRRGAPAWGPSLCSFLVVLNGPPFVTGMCPRRGDRVPPQSRSRRSPICGPPQVSGRAP